MIDSAPSRRWLPGLRARVTAAFALGALLLSATFAIITYELTRAYLVRQRDTSVVRQAAASAALVQATLQTADVDVARFTSTLGRPSGAHPVVRYRGEWFAATIAVGRDVLPAELRERVDAGEPAMQRFRHDGRPFVAVGIPLPTARAAYFAVFRLDELERTLGVISTSLVAAALLTTVAGALAGRWTSGRALEPVRATADAAAEIATGRLDVRLSDTGDPDLDVVATAFNAMTDALRERVEREARFASDVSHELRTPLTTITAALEVVTSRSDELPPRARKALDLLTAEVARFERLVTDLLEISRMDAGAAVIDAEPLRITELVLHAVGRMTDGVNVDVDADAVDAVVRGDKRRLERVVANLVENAERHAGGVVRIAVGVEGEMVTVAVEDAGPGVPAADRDRVFHRFVRGAAARAASGGTSTGTGLGLALVAEHVRLHGGTIVIEDRPGGGARFVVRLPLDRHEGDL